ncbi:MAG: sugar ABC transporter permease [Acidimicrobiales bacterium]|nr:sugar ABC transporter permease [Acidimicrobiales bacterium]
MPSLGSGLGSGLISFALSQLLGGALSSVSGSTAWLLDQVGRTLDATTEVQLKGGWFGGHVMVMGELAGVLVLPLLLLAVGQAVVRQDPGLLVRVVLVQLPLAVLLSAAAVELIQLSLDWVDQVSAWVAGTPGHGGLRGALDHLASGLSPGMSGVVPTLVALLSEVIMGIGAFALFLELAVRGAAIYLAVLFVPMVIAGLVWPVTARFGRRLAETIAALVLSKLVMVGALSLAAGAVTGGLVRGELASVVEGVALLLLAVFAPFSLLRLLPFIEAGAIGHLEGAGRRLVTSSVAVSSRMAGAVAGGSETGVAGRPWADTSGPPDHPGSETPSHLEAILGSGPGDRPAGGSWPEPPDPFDPPGEVPPAPPRGGRHGQ